ncbi:hypothetical protein JW948_13815 [bacterium]|nr:hypothetical protein [bacterium]
MNMTMSPGEIGASVAQFVSAGTGKRNQNGRPVSGHHQSGTAQCASSIPDGFCSGHHPFLLNNHAFFVQYLQCRQNGDPAVDCERLIRHLNDCYRCFELFCQTLHAYFQACQPESERSYVKVEE